MPACNDCLAESERLANLAGPRLAVSHEPRPISDGDNGEAAEPLPALSQWTVCKHDPSYPQRLAELDDAPPVLYGYGDFRALAHLTKTNGVAIVGARRASAYGREVSYSLGNNLAASGQIVINGLALGIDGAAHRGAIQAAAPSIAVLAGGPAEPYPRSHHLLHRQVAETGCVISEHPTGYPTRAEDFAARQRIIAALSAVTVLVEGATDSGAMHAVDSALAQGTVVGAVPGPVTGPLSQGPNTLLARQSARVVCDAGDVLDLLKQLPTN